MSSRSVCISLFGKIMAHINFIISKQGLGTITDNMRGTCFIFPTVGMANKSPSV